MSPGIKRKEGRCPGSIQQMSWPSLGLTVSLLCSHQPSHLGLAAPSLQGSASKAQLGPQPFALLCPSLLLGQVQTELASHWLYPPSLCPHSPLSVLLCPKHALLCFYMCCSLGLKPSLPLLYSPNPSLELRGKATLGLSLNPISPGG